MEEGIVINLYIMITFDRSSQSSAGATYLVSQIVCIGALIIKNALKIIERPMMFIYCWLVDKERRPEILGELEFVTIVSLGICMLCHEIYIYIYNINAEKHSNKV